MSHAARIVTRVLIAGWSVLLLGGCRRSEPPPAVAPSAAAAAGAPSALPPGHPPVDRAVQGGHGLPAGVGGLSWTRPAEWKEEKPSSGMRQAQYRVSGSGGDAECVVYYFGAGEGGD